MKINPNDPFSHSSECDASLNFPEEESPISQEFIKKKPGAFNLDDVLGSSLKEKTSIHSRFSAYLKKAAENVSGFFSKTFLSAKSHDGSTICATESLDSDFDSSSETSSRLRITLPLEDSLNDLEEEIFSIAPLEEPSKGEMFLLSKKLELHETAVSKEVSPFEKQQLSLTKSLEIIKKFPFSMHSIKGMCDVILDCSFALETKQSLQDFRFFLTKMKKEETSKLGSLQRKLKKLKTTENTPLDSLKIKTLELKKSFLEKRIKKADEILEFLPSSLSEKQEAYLELHAIAREELCWKLFKLSDSQKSLIRQRIEPYDQKTQRAIKEALYDHNIEVRYHLEEGGPEVKITGEEFDSIIDIIKEITNDL